ncbi:nicotinate-nucleotide--dimethylbenzimidazole phosphoribosyltransferase [Aquihabitans sp. G128]|nr:nicotinate-nucleotide--dimethylbenzimidazole phosphoribosyltransferase [Aquihabitans sp. G128]QXC63044.1 nicotinate-nucleotide--dimethylbenzimidazole phosphoribosyltransferase [Aquihabitans sp. G128]
MEDAGSSTGNLRDEPPLELEAAEALLARGRALGQEAGRRGLVALGEVGIGNTTVAAALAAWLLDLAPADAVGRGAGADAAMLVRKEEVVAAALARTAETAVGAAAGAVTGAGPVADAVAALASLGGPDVAVLTGVVLGAAEVGAPVVLDGLLTTVAAALAVRAEPAVASHLVAGQRSREAVHQAVLVSLGLEPLLDLRFRAGEGVGACLASGVLLDALELRRTAGRTA